MHPHSLPGGGVEQDPAELLESVLAAGQAAVAAARAPAHALALANQGETVLAWDRRTGQPLTPAIVWQDRRSAGVCARLAGQADALAAITGLPLDPYFAAPKMTWLRENLTRDDGVVTTTDSWLLARLGAGVPDRRQHRVPDPAPRPGHGGLVTGRVRGVRPGSGRAARGGRLRRDQRRDGRVRPPDPGGRPGRGPAGRAAGRGLPDRGRSQMHLRHRRVPAGHHRAHGGPLGARAVRVGGLAASQAKRPTAWTGRCTRQARRCAG